MSEAVVQATLPHLSPPVRAMVQLQMLTGARSDEVCALRAVDIDRTDPEVWIYRPQRHKTAHHGQERVVFIGPRAQAVILPFLAPNLAAYLFRPEAARAWRAERQRSKHPSSMTLHGAHCTERSRVKVPVRPLRERYDKNTYAQAVRRACRLAFPAPPGLDDEQARAWRRQHSWHPHQLRHTFGTAVRARHGAEMVGTMLGDQSPNMVAVYAEANIERGRTVAKQLG